MNLRDQNRQEVFFKLQCFNYIGLEKTFVSQVITVVRNGPDVSSSSVRLMPIQETYYPRTDAYFSQGQDIWMTWFGVTDSIGIQTCEVHLSYIYVYV